ncbi:MAG TPA: DMT family transporter [Acidimicrobiales bacterium]|nr:DMT family transporter [Acidimicrobiales bacterium]
MAPSGRRQVRLAHLSVALAGVCFGSTFIPVKDAVRHAGPVPFLAARFVIAALILWPVARRRTPADGEALWGLAAGVPLLAGYLLQTYGLRYTTASVSAFITYLLVIMVPLIVAVTARRLPSPAVVVGVVLSTVGLWLLTGAHPRLGLGEVLTIGCAFAFAVNIIAIDAGVRRVDPIRLTAMQLAVVGFGCLVPGFFAGGYRMPASSWAAAAYTAVTASALAFGLQVYGQRRVGPTRTSLLLMIEPVTAAVIGYLTGERLGGTGLGGAALILAGIAVAEAPAVTGDSAPVAADGQPPGPS